MAVHDAMYRWPSPFFLVRRIINQRTVILLLFPPCVFRTSTFSLSFRCRISYPRFSPAAKHFHLPASQRTRGKKGPLLPLPPLIDPLRFFSESPLLTLSVRSRRSSRKTGWGERRTLPFPSPLPFRLRSLARTLSNVPPPPPPLERERERIRERGQRRGRPPFVEKGSDEDAPSLQCWPLLFRSRLFLLLPPPPLISVSSPFLWAQA